MKKFLLFSALLCAISGKLLAQTSLGEGKFGVAIDAGLPVGDVSNSYSLAIGADLKYSVPVVANFSISLSAGYTELIGKDFVYNYSFGNTSGTIAGRADNVGVTPVKAGVRYCANGTTGFFAEAQAGVAFIGNNGGSSFAYSPAIGYVFNGGFGAGIRYESWIKDGGVNQVALRLTYGF